jgi:uncharacterized repeat protein (TIGR01451 family)
MNTVLKSGSRLGALLVAIAVLSMGLAVPANAATITAQLSGPATVEPGQHVTYKATVHNAKDTPSHILTFGFNINGGGGIHRHLTFLGTSAFNCRQRDNTNVAWCDPVRLGPRQTVSFDINFKVNSNAVCGDTITALFDVKSSVGTEVIWSNAVFTRVVCPTTPTPTPTATPTPTPAPVTCSPDVTVTTPNQNVTLSTNAGAAAQWSAPNANVTSGTGSSFTTSYPATATGVFFVNVLHNQQSAVCKVMVNAVVTPTPTPTATPTPTPAVNKGIDVTKTDDTSVTRPGNSLTYRIKVINTGNVKVEDIQLKDTVPSQLEVTNISDSGDHQDSVITWSNIVLDAGESKTVTFTGRVKSSTAHGTELFNEVWARSAAHNLSDVATDTTRVEREPQVAATVAPTPIVIVTTPAPVAVPVTAKTGANLITLVSTLLGAAGMVTVGRKLF